MADTVIGRLVAEIEGDTSGLKGAVREAEAEFDKVEKKAEATGKATGGAFGRAGERIEKATEGARKFAGALSSTVGIATGILGVVTVVTSALIAMSSAFGKNTEEIAKQNKAFDDMNARLKGFDAPSRNAADRLDAIRDEFKELRLEIRQSDAAYKDRIRLEDELYDALDRRLQLEREQIGRENFEATRQAYELQKALIQEVSGTEEDAERLRSEATKKRIFQLEEEAKLQQGLVEELIALEDKRLEKALGRIADEKKAQEEARREQQRLDTEAARETARQAAEAFRVEFEGVADNIFGSTSGFTTRLDTLLQEVQGIRSETRGLKV